VTSKNDNLDLRDERCDEKLVKWNSRIWCSRFRKKRGLREEAHSQVAAKGCQNGNPTPGVRRGVGYPAPKKKSLTPTKS